MCFRRFVSDRGGFSFAEVLVAAAFTAAAALVLGGMLSRAVQDRAVAEPGIVAVHLALEEAEALKAAPWQELASRVPAAVPGFEGFTREVRVSPAGLLRKRVEVVVSYAAPGGVQEVVLVFERARTP